jgi:hypothetical protein
VEGKITRISVTWAEHTGQGTQHRIYNVLPDEEMHIRPERMEDLMDDLTLICEQIQEARDRAPNGTTSAGFDRIVRRIK